MRTTWIRCVSSGGVDWRSASKGRILAEAGCAPSTSAAARRTNGSASLETARGQLGERLRQLGSVDENFQSCGRAARGPDRAAQASERGVVERARALEDPEAVDALTGRCSGRHDLADRGDGRLAAALDELVGRRRSAPPGWDRPRSAISSSTDDLVRSTARRPGRACRPCPW